MKVKNEKTIRFIHLFLSFTAIILAILGIEIALKYWGGNLYWRYIPLHSAMEMSGTIVAIFMAIVLFQRKEEENSNKFFLIALGFLSMGLLDGFHSILPEGNRFVLLHSLASFTGGLFFSAIWLPDPMLEKYASHKNRIIQIVIAFCLFVSLYPFIFPQSVLEMILNGKFTPTAIFIYIAAGILFLIAGVRFYLDFYQTGNRESHLFFYLITFFSIANILFSHSAIWNGEWWLWHLLRLTAYLLTLWFVVRGYLKTVFDLKVSLTQLAQAEEATKFAYMELDQLFNTAADGLCLIDRDFKISRINDTFCNLFGLSKNETEGKNCYQVLPNSSCKSLRCPLTKILGGSDRFEFDTSLNTNRGQKISCIITARPFRNPHGELIGIVESFKDISEHKKMEEELNKYHSYLEDLVKERTTELTTANKQLQLEIAERKKMEEEIQKAQKLESIGILAGGIGHDYNNLLTTIIGNLSLGKLHTKPGSTMVKILTKIEKASLEAKKLTKQLLTFAKGGYPLRKTIAISKFLEDTTHLALSGSKVRCQLSLPDDLWWAEIDEDQMSQAIGNLIINADQAMPDGGLIKVEAHNAIVKEQEGLPLKAGKYLKITIKDQGWGIPEEHLQKVFDPYFTTKEKGSGLGLAITYSIVKKHEGFISVKSEINVGTTFFIYLPAAEKEIFMVKEVEEEGFFLGQGKILFMDDQQGVRDITGEMLQYIGYDVEFAVDGEEAIELYKKAKESGVPFDVVMLDLIIPGGMGGEETIQKLLQIDPEVKAIVSSGYSSDPIMSEYEQYGFSGGVPKPYEIKGLSEVLHRVIMHTKKPSS